MNAPRDAKEIARLWFEKVWNQRDNALARELMAPDAVGHLEGGQEIVGPEAFLGFQASFLEAVPDLRIGIVALVADEANVCTHWTAQGTHSGPGMGMIPSGMRVFFRGVTWLEVAEGRITSGRDFWNKEGLMQTMAGGPAPDEALA
ncbi:ester cyclase [Luteolibacter yonseiensis]|uniref:Ester cyclase n=1 Tax=Luteolibacter yonseiensis TaxID=1144680 RepID=A0A934QWJ7_9BACT|nr:ester cyclase [Luteolibacter yonseiensis]MBK1814038.1 ester cyclase [Luteolibacter yonseiensis]